MRYARLNILNGIKYVENRHHLSSLALYNDDSVAVDLVFVAIFVVAAAVKQPNSSLIFISTVYNGQKPQKHTFIAWRDNTANEITLFPWK